MGMLLFEIGVEYMPAAWVGQASSNLLSNATRLFAEARLLYEENDASVIKASHTPRRLVLMVDSLLDRQEDTQEIITGPSVQVAFDRQGNPTKAAIGFAQKNGVEIGQIHRGPVPGKKGEYIFFSRTVEGSLAEEILPSLLKDLIRSLPMLKSMHWADHEERFIRPIRWVTALHNGKVIPFSFAGVQSGSVTYGHRFPAPEEIDLKDCKDRKSLEEYIKRFDVDNRFSIIENGLSSRAKEEGGFFLDTPTKSLSSEVCNMVENPKVICGKFAKVFLITLPKEVIISVLQTHQRCFPICSKEDELTSYFCAVVETPQNTRAEAIICRGYERVLSARLSDAVYFYMKDCRKDLDELNSELKGILFHKDLGTVHDKVSRLVFLAEQFKDRIPAVDGEVLVRSAKYCKADLATHMVGEFPELRGVMCGHYAGRAGEDESVCQSISTHNSNQGSMFPDKESLSGASEGAFLSVLDKMDTIVGGFLAGMEPTGSSDPYALRREVIGMLGIAMKYQWLDLLPDLMEMSAARFINLPLKFQWKDIEHNVKDFIGARVNTLLIKYIRTLDKGSILFQDALNEKDIADAVLRAGWQDTRERTASVFEKIDSLEVVTMSYKRIVNILKGRSIDTPLDPDKFAKDEEKKLWESFVNIRNEADRLILKRDYGSALDEFVKIQKPIDCFFEKVLVMDEDESIRNNRLALLRKVQEMFLNVVDFSCLTFSSDTKRVLEDSI